MTLSKRAMVCAALVFALGLFSATAFGGVRDYGTPYTDAGGVTWTGQTHFSGTTTGGAMLTGDIDWIVYGKGQFPYTDSGYVPAADQYTYVYQITNSTTSVAISDFTFTVDQAVGGIDSFVSTGRVEGVQATDTDYTSGEFVEWIFTNDAINPGDLSAGLVFVSPKAPTTTSTGRVTDGGKSVGVDSLPCPGPNDIPEPSTCVLLLVGLGCALGARRFVRR
jgi:hypothetical protein